MTEPNWAQDEISAYTPVDYAPLQRLYEERGIPASDPFARATLLADVLALNYAEQIGLAAALIEKGKAAALNHLEEGFRLNHGRISVEKSGIRSSAATYIF